MEERTAQLTGFRTAAISAEVLLGFLTFTGSLMAAGKLQEVIPTRPITYRNQNLINLSAIAGGVRLRGARDRIPRAGRCFQSSSSLALLFGVLLILPIGGADMPTVISLLNSYAGLSAVAMGFVLDNKLLITAGALDGSSGLILSIIMCRAMNRSFTNVLFGAFGQVGSQANRKEGRVRSASAEEVFAILEGSRSVVIAGLRVGGSAGATSRAGAGRLAGGAGQTSFAIHPVAGRCRAT